MLGVLFQCGKLCFRGCFSMRGRQCTANIDCTDAGKANTFTWGCDKFKKDVLMKHVATVDHRAAMEARSGRRDQERAVAMANQSQQQAVIVALKTVYFMSKKNLSNDIFPDLKHFLFLQVHA